MVQVVSQETFNEAVTENMNLLDLGVEEAIRETVEQFKSQGVDLSNIVKESWCVLGEEDPLVTAIERITVSSKTDLGHFNTVIELCSKDVSFKLKAAELGAYSKILDVLKNSQDHDTRIKCLEGLCALMDGYPDLLEEEGLTFILEKFKFEERDEVLYRMLEWTRLCCVSHEQNRKTLMERELNHVLQEVLDKNKSSRRVVEGVCKVTTALTLDDDIRDTVSNSHMHACLLATTLLPTLVPLIDSSDTEKTAHILNTLSSLLVRDTLCQQFVDLGGLERLFQVLGEDPSIKILTRGFNVLACLAGHDKIKDSIIKAGLAPKIASSLAAGESSLPLCRSVVSLIARLSLRSPTNSKALFEAGLGEGIVRVMRLYAKDKKIQSLSCLAVRNMVSRNVDLRPKFLALEVEGPLRQIPKDFPDLLDNSKAALLALDLNVKLKEEWTGKHGDIVKGNH